MIIIYLSLINIECSNIVCPFGFVANENFTTCEGFF